jgi:hypothetical protein
MSMSKRYRCRNCGERRREEMQVATVFFWYSHVDVRDQLEAHLAMLKNQGLIEAWHDLARPSPQGGRRIRR